jgi:DNA-binding transcriptional MerR regulator
VDKAPDAFRTISEVAEDLDLPQHVLRFWETRFPQIKPLKRGGGRRYYRPDDVMLLRGIRHLLYGEGYTIKGVQRIIREQGVRHIMTLWQESQNESPSDIPVAPGHQAFAPPMARGEPHATSHHTQAWADEHVQTYTGDEDRDDNYDDEPALEIPAIVIMEQPASVPVTRVVPIVMDERSPASASSGLDERSIAREDLRRLQATLYELMECKRILEGAR